MLIIGATSLNVIFALFGLVTTGIAIRRKNFPDSTRPFPGEAPYDAAPGF
jgi:hypothetical protein